MRVVYHIPAEKFGFVEYEMDISDFENISSYDDIKKILAENKGLERKEWNDVLDRYLREEETSSDEHERMNERQRWLIHELDKAHNRIIK